MPCFTPMYAVSNAEAITASECGPPSEVGERRNSSTAMTAAGPSSSLSIAMGIPAVMAGVVESECCHGRVPAHIPFVAPARLADLYLGGAAARGLICAFVGAPSRSAVEADSPAMGGQGRAHHQGRIFN